MQSTMEETLPGWLLNRLKNLDMDPPPNRDRVFHYEASLQGPHNALLNCYYPLQYNYLVKPQPRLRQRIAPRAHRAHYPQSSVDSYSQIVATSAKDDIPDFLVCLATESLHNDIPLIIWELKRDDAKHEETAAQIQRYEAWCWQYIDDYPGHQMFLVLVEEGSATVYQFNVDTIHGGESEVFVRWEKFDVVSAKMHNLLWKMRELTV